MWGYVLIWYSRRDGGFAFQTSYKTEYRRSKISELDLTVAESKATYEEIKEYVLEQSGFKVSNLYIAQEKQKCGIIERENYNKPKFENAKQPSGIFFIWLSEPD